MFGIGNYNLEVAPTRGMRGLGGAAGGLGAMTESPSALPGASTMPVIQVSGTGMAIYAVAAGVSAIASSYHGYKRNGKSIGWGIGWFILGWVFPVITPAVALAQGFGKRRGR